MATLFDLGLLEYFSSIFLFLFVLVVIYGILEVVKIVGENKGLNALIALCIAVFATFATKPRMIIQGIIPWFALLFIFGMFVMVAMRFIFGESADAMFKQMLGGDTGAGWWILIGAGTILLVVFSSAVGPDLTPGMDNTTVIEGGGGSGSTSTGNWQSNVLNTLYHPKILGTVVILVIALFAIKLISTVPKA